MVSGSRRHLVKLGAIAMSAALLTGCSTGSDSAGGDKNIRMLVNITPVLTKQFYKDLVAGYVAGHPGVKVTIEAPTGRGIEDTLKQQLAAGSPPDILAAWAEHGSRRTDGAAARRTVGEGRTVRGGVQAGRQGVDGRRPASSSSRWYFTTRLPSPRLVSPKRPRRLTSSPPRCAS